MIWKYRLSALASALLTITASGAHAQTVTVTAQALGADSIRVDFPGFSSAPGCFLGPQVTRFLNSNQDNVDSLNVGAASVTYNELPGGTYHFTVTGCMPNGGFEPDYETFQSNNVTIAGLPMVVPPTPGSIAANVSNENEISVNWAASPDANSYRIAVRTQPVEGWTPSSGDDWSGWSNYNDVGNQTTASYVNLDPAIYQYRVIACNASGCSSPVLSEAAIVEPPQQNLGGEYYLPDAKIRAIWTAPEGCLVLFEDLPEACETKFSNAHALIQFENPNHEKMYSQVFIAKAMGKRIDVWFDDNGDCDSLSTLMTIGRMELVEPTAGQQGAL